MSIEIPNNKTPTVAELNASLKKEVSPEVMAKVASNEVNAKSTVDATKQAQSIKLLNAVRDIIGLNKDSKFELTATEKGANIKLAHGADAGKEGSVNADLNFNISATGSLLTKLQEALKEAPKSLNDVLKLIAPKIVSDFGGKEEDVIAASTMKSVFGKIMKNLPSMSQVASALEGINITPESITAFIKNAFSAVQAPKPESK